jgi:hypothetical protein
MEGYSAEKRLTYLPRQFLAPQQLQNIKIKSTNNLQEK